MASAGAPPPFPDGAYYRKPEPAYVPKPDVDAGLPWKIAAWAVAIAAAAAYFWVNM